MQTLTTFEALDAKLDECRSAMRTSDDTARALFQGFEMAFPTDHPSDPFDPAYREFQLRLYERVAQRPYSTSNEASDIDVAEGVRRPFPYSTGSTTTAGHHLGTIGFVLQTLRLRPGARILEFGPGYGGLTLALARLGFDVTAVDVEPRFCEIIRRQADRLGLDVTVVNADFFWAETVTDPYDAVVFFECFHHCDDHLRLLRALHGVLAPGGQVYFAAEPILPDYGVPWGLRMDGEALWAIREHGWLELGFRDSYFRAALAHTGWIARKRASADLWWVSVWEASATPDGAQWFAASDPRIGTLVGRKMGDAIVVAAGAAGFGTYGPHVPLAPGRYRGVLSVVPGAPLEGVFVLDACADRGLTSLASGPLDPAAARRDGEAALRFTLDSFRDEVEFRLYCAAGSIISVAGVRIEPIPD